MLDRVTILEVPLHDADMDTLMHLREQYPQAVLRIETEAERQPAEMDESCFWRIMDLFDWNQHDNAAVMAPAVQALSQYSEADIQRFHDLLNEKLYALDGQRFAEHLGSNRYQPDQQGAHFSVDSFLYSRCAVVANGKTFFEQVLEHPEMIPKEFTFESLLYLPDYAWQLKTGKEWEYFPETWYETFSNPDGWPGIVPLKDRLLNG